ncbi:MAG: DNA polymerase III subunit epsilon [Pseudomonadota bacterium]
MREIVMDTETTGLDAKNGDRLIEIGCIEIFSRIPTGVEYHAFINPDGRQVHPEAEAVHGISNDFLSDKPLFKDVVSSFLEFIGNDTPLVIHNASFDIGFINMELGRLGLDSIVTERLVDTLALARRKHPAGPNKLDALCRRYGIDNSKRDKHGAIIDSLLLAEVYVELLGERQAVLGLNVGNNNNNDQPEKSKGLVSVRQRTKPLAERLSEADIARHKDFIETLGENAIWKKRRKV